ncbi:MAG: hypothetical protein AN488_20800 [Anabaena sp. WA113]|nr:MAG: hypothetical protein AN488_20800 [Anabaena sp. WA113]
MGTLAGGLGCFPLDNEAYPPLSHWQCLPLGILSLSRFGTGLPARTETVLYPPNLIITAAPQHISGRTS